MQPSTEPVCVVIKRGEAHPGKQDLDYFTGVSAGDSRIEEAVYASGRDSSTGPGEAAPACAS